MDRRLIRERISRLKKELKDVERHRELIRGQRKQSGLKVAKISRLYFSREEQY